MIGSTSVLSSLGAEIRLIAGVSPDDPTIAETFWSLIEATILHKRILPPKGRRSRSR
jgi:hypothetical protein